MSSDEDYGESNYGLDAMLGFMANMSEEEDTVPDNGSYQKQHEAPHFLSRAAQQSECHSKVARSHDRLKPPKEQQNLASIEDADIEAKIAALKAQLEQRRMKRQTIETITPAPKKQRLDEDESIHAKRALNSALTSPLSVSSTPHRSKTSAMNKVPGSIRGDSNATSSVRKTESTCGDSDANSSVRKTESPRASSSNGSGGTGSDGDSKAITAEKADVNISGHAPRTHAHQTGRAHVTSTVPITAVGAPVSDGMEMFSGLAIKGRTVSSLDLKRRMEGKTFVKLVELPGKIKSGGGDIQDPWAIIGVLSHKSMTKESKNGKKFSVWTLSDLGPAECSLFLFGEAFTSKWKEIEGAIVGVVSADVMPTRDNDSSSKVSLSVSAGNKIMKLGMSTHFGKCKGTNKDGGGCRKAVNTAHGEFCVYHVMGALRNSKAKRMDLNHGSWQAQGPMREGKPQRHQGNLAKRAFSLSTASAGRTGRAASRDVPQKLSDETFAKQSQSGYFKRTMSKLQPEAKKCGEFGPGALPPDASAEDVARRRRRLMLQKAVGGGAPDVDGDGTTAVSASAAALLKVHGKSPAVRPTLGRGLSRTANLTLSLPCTLEAKARAAELIRRKGGITKQDPNAIGTAQASAASASATTFTAPPVVAQRQRLLSSAGRSSRFAEHERLKAHGTPVRAHSAAAASAAPTPSRTPAVASAHSSTKRAGAARSATGLAASLGMASVVEGSPQWNEMMKRTSSNAAVLADADDAALAAKFAERSKVDKMQQKAESTMEVDVTVFKCQTCNTKYPYVPKECKEKGHKLSKGTGKKRFFTCNYCNKHVTFINVTIPQQPCTKCNRRPPSYTRAAMRQEKKTINPAKQLNIRGTERKFIKGLST